MWAPNLEMPSANSFCAGQGQRTENRGQRTEAAKLCEYPDTVLHQSRVLVSATRRPRTRHAPCLERKRRVEARQHGRTGSRPRQQETDASPSTARYYLAWPELKRNRHIVWSFLPRNDVAMSHVSRIHTSRAQHRHLWEADETMVAFP